MAPSAGVTIRSVLIPRKSWILVVARLALAIPARLVVSPTDCHSTPTALPASVRLLPTLKSWATTTSLVATAKPLQAVLSLVLHTLMART